jgi:AraC-like DNA-binding protein
LRTGDVFNPPPGYELVVSTDEAAGWGALSIPSQDLSRLSIALLGHDLGASSVARRYELGSAAEFTQLILLCDQAQSQVVEIMTPAGLNHWNDALLRALFRCVVGGEMPADRSAARRHSQIIRRLHAVLDEHAEDPLELTGVCLAVGTTLSTLHLCCQEFLGMSPARYLRLRRMNLAHRALLDGVPGITNVTEIALRYGFWELGRFAEYYRRLFGETPSATLGQKRVTTPPWRFGTTALSWETPRRPDTAGRQPEPAMLR